MFMVPNQRWPGLNVFVVAAGRPAGRRSVQDVAAAAQPFRRHSGCPPPPSAWPHCVPPPSPLLPDSGGRRGVVRGVERAQPRHGLGPLGEHEDLPGPQTGPHSAAGEPGLE